VWSVGDVSWRCWLNSCQDCTRTSRKLHDNCTSSPEDLRSTPSWPSKDSAHCLKSSAILVWRSVSPVLFCKLTSGYTAMQVVLVGPE